MMIMALTLIAFLWIVILGFAGSSVRELRLAQRALASERAQWAAEAGASLTVQDLLKNANYTPPTSYVNMQHGADAYKVEVFKDSVSPVKIPAGTLYVRSTGKDRTGTLRRVAVVVKLGGTTKSLLDFSVFAQSLEMSGGCYIDSFDSTLGPYIRGSAANVATNATSPGSIELKGGSWVQGNIQVGPGGTAGDARPSRPTKNSENTVWKDWSCWSLSEAVMDKPLDYPPVSAPAAGTTDLKVKWDGADIAPGAYADLTANGGGEVRLTGGTYIFRSIKLTGGARLSFTGDKPAVIYVTEDFDLSGGILNNTSKSPKNLLFMLAKDVSAKITGGAQTFATIYGPEADVNLTGGTDIYGAIVARSVKLQGGASIHYDVDLAKNAPPTLSTGTSSGGGSVVSWQRL